MLFYRNYYFVSSKFGGVNSSNYLCKKYLVMGLGSFTDLGNAALGVFNTLLGYKLSSSQHAKDREFNAEQAQISRDWQEKMWNLSNEYNHPKQVMQRLAESGLNPNLVYGDGATTLAAHVGNAPSASAPTDSTKYPDFNQALFNVMSMRKNQAEVDLIESEELKNRETAKNLQKEREGKEIENMFSRDSYQLKLDALRAEIDLKSALEQTEASKRNQIQYECSRLEEETNYLKSKTENERRMTDKEIEKMETDIDNSISLTASLVAKNNAEGKKALADAWLAKVEAQIKNDTENNSIYKEQKVREQLYRTRKALAEGNEAEVKEEMIELKRELFKRGMKMRNFLSIFVDPVTESLGNIFSGSFNVSHKVP